MNWRHIAETVIAAVAVAILFTAVRTYQDVQGLKLEIRAIQRYVMDEAG